MAYSARHLSLPLENVLEENTVVYKYIDLFRKDINVALLEIHVSKGDTSVSQGYRAIGIEIRETSRLDKDAPCLLTTDSHLLQAGTNVQI